MEIYGNPRGRAARELCGDFLPVIGTVGTAGATFVDRSLSLSLAQAQRSDRLAQMVKHNNVVPNRHFHKDWQVRVRTWFNQAPSKKSRRNKRAAKAEAIFPRPVGGREQQIGFSGLT